MAGLGFQVKMEFYLFENVWSFLKLNTSMIGIHPFYPNELRVPNISVAELLTGEYVQGMRV